MKLEQSFDVAAPLERVWSALIDVEHVAPCLPGAAVTGRNDDGTYNGTFTIKIGPTTASYAGKLEMENVDESAHRATMQANGTDKRGQGGAKATIVSSLSELAEGGTRVEVDTDYQITGRLARFGRGGMIEDISERLLREFAARLQESLGGDAGSEQTGEGVETAPAADEEAADDDRWETVNVAALTRDVAPEGDERSAASEGPATAAEAPAPEAGEAPPPEADEAPPPEEDEAPAPEADEAPPPEPDEAPPPPTAPPPPQAPPPPRALSAPPPPAEPLDAGALVGAVMWERVRRNAIVPLAFIAGLLLAVFLFRRHRRS
jgi:uncharacterized protein